MGCFSCISHPSKDMRDYNGGDIDTNSSGSCILVFFNLNLWFHCCLCDKCVLIVMCLFGFLKICSWWEEKGECEWQW